MKRAAPNATHEDLIAYLDGELDEGAASRIEQALSQDSSLQVQADVLAQTFEMLEVLSPPKASQEFTQRTMESVHLSSVESPDADADLQAETLEAPVLVSPTTPIRTATGVNAPSAALMSLWAAGLVVSAATGFLMTNQWIGRATHDERHDMPLIERLDVIRSVDDLEFIKSLEERGFQHHVPTATPSRPLVDPRPEGFRQPRNPPNPE